MTKPADDILSLVVRKLLFHKSLYSDFMNILFSLSKNQELYTDCSTELEHN